MLKSPSPYDDLLKGLTTKSDKIRALAKQGVSTADIARELGIRYQHARNVIKDANVHHIAEPEGMAEAEAPYVPQVSTVADHAWVKLDEGGGLVVPPHLLAKVGLKPGDSVHLRCTEDGLEFFSRHAAMARIHKITAPFKRPGVSEVDEFLAERRSETEADDAKWAARLET